MEVVEELSCRREVSVCRDLSVDVFVGRLRKMEGEKERLVWRGDFCAEVGERNPVLRGAVCSMCDDLTVCSELVSFMTSVEEVCGRNDSVCGSIK